MASVYNTMVSKSSISALKSHNEAYLICKLDTIQAVHKKLSNLTSTFDAIVIAFIVLCLMNSEVSGSAI